MIEPYQHLKDSIMIKVRYRRSPRNGKYNLLLSPLLTHRILRQCCRLRVSSVWLPWSNLGVQSNQTTTSQSWGMCVVCLQRFPHLYVLFDVLPGFMLQYDRLHCVFLISSQTTLLQVLVWSGNFAFMSRSCWFSGWLVSPITKNTKNIEYVAHLPVKP